jgi:beta-lactamase class A
VTDPRKLYCSEAVRCGGPSRVSEIFAELGVVGSAWAAPVDGPGVGICGDDLVTPASVAKVQIALAAEHAMVTGGLDGQKLRILSPQRRTTGPVGISLLRDEVRMSARDLVTMMLTSSDNVATDELLALVGPARINQLTARLGLTATRITGDLRTMLDAMAGEAGFTDYPALAAHDPAVRPPSWEQIRQRLHDSAALDPARGWSTTGAETVQLLQAIWTDTAAAPQACAAVRHAMSQQLTRHRIAAGFGPGVSVAAKSGGLMGLVRNEAGVVTFPDRQRYAVAVFTRGTPGTTTDPARVDAGIGRIARTLIDELRR